MPVRIMFVDDEVNILQSIERSLFDMMDEWDMVFASSGAEALSSMDARQVDVVVSDMRMPGMSGAELLEQVKKRFPKTARFVLTGQVDEETALRSVGSAHQFLSKPCDPDQLQDLIKRTLLLRSRMDDENLLKVVGDIEGLPTLPAVFEELSEELNDPEPSTRIVSEIMGKDVAMCAKIMHLANSAFFGLRNEVTSISQAVTYLGVNTIRSLALAHQAFSCKSPSELPKGLSLEALTIHGVAVGACCRAIASNQDRDSPWAKEAFTAGVLHDVGKIVLAVNLPKEYEKILETALESGRALFETEYEVLGTTHSDVGAYLLGIWGLPESVVEAVALHHAVFESDSPKAMLPLIVGFANAATKVGGEDPSLDTALRTAGFPTDRVSAGDLEAWSAICVDVLRTDADA